MRWQVLVPLILMSGAAHGQTQSVGDGRADRFLATFDLNHDGRVTRDELNRALSVQFQSHARYGALSLEQFVSLREETYRASLLRRFKSLDWNNDGRLTLEEFATPLRARFETFSGSTGTENCAGGEHASFNKARFCRETDLNHDGQVTRTELDQVTAKRFAAMAGTAKSVSGAQFVADALRRGAASDAGYFRKLDRDGDGRLSFAEFAASGRALFARLDRNKDGVLTRDELATPRVYASRRTASGG
ncbi:MAG: EF-hand domain-containing protein [Alphaproteobacteria bacterium]|nr:EF-hand domain-containing protein [Alphaproteobacteria bacterium]MBV9692603.1 EF-hand domain-containing protein [Alphaproteobacteria bacterium]